MSTRQSGAAQPAMERTVAVEKQAYREAMEPLARAGHRPTARPRRKRAGDCIRQLIASGLGVEEIRASIGADSLAFVSLEGLTAASNQPAANLCRACFTGEYPIEIPQPDLIGKHVLEGIARNASAEHIVEHVHADDGTKVVHNGGDGVDGMDALIPAGGAEDALSRP